MKKWIVVLSMVTMCIGMCACGSNEEMTDAELEQMMNNLDEQDIENALMGLDGGQNAEVKEDKDSVETKVPEYTVSPDPSEEIVNAALNSGLVQMDNMVFQTGCYLTADEFVSLYADTYDAIYYKGNSEKEGTYEERKDYLLEYVEDPWRDDALVMGKQQYKYERYAITFTPKEGMNGREFNAYVVNITSPDEKITLDKGLVFTCEFTHDDLTAKYLEWLPMGFGRNTHTGDNKPEQNTINQNYTVKDIKDYFISQGFVEDMYANDKTYYAWGTSSFSVCVHGEPNAANLRPVYLYSFRINEDTDKVVSVSCTINNMLAVN